MFLYRAADRAIGVVSTLLLARLLSPADFGLVAMATAVIAMVELATAFGFDVALIQTRDPSPAHYNTAWTLNILLGIGGCALVAALSWPMATFFSEPRLVVVMLLLGLALFIQGFENIGIVDFRRTMNFEKEFRFLAAKRLAGFVVTLVIALLLKSYIALLLGTVAARAVGLVLSYSMQPRRPRFSLTHAHELIHFSKWTLIGNAIIAGLQRAPHFLVGRMLGAGSLGLYVVAADIGGLPTTELAAPINRAAIPGYASLIHDRHELRRTFEDISGVVALLALPAGVGLACVAASAVAVLLGEKWVGAVPVVQLLALSGAFVATASNNGAVCVATGKPRLNTLMLALRLIVLGLLLFLLVPRFGMQGAAWAELLGAAASFMFSWAIAIRVLDLPGITPLRIYWRPGIAVLGMWGVLHACDAYWMSGLPRDSILALLLRVLLGCTTFGAVITLLWIAASRPEGPESQLLRRARRALGMQET